MSINIDNIVDRIKQREKEKEESKRRKQNWEQYFQEEGEDVLNEFTGKELKEECRVRGLPVSGSKSVLINRLADFVRTVRGGDSQNNSSTSHKRKHKNTNDGSDSNENESSENESEENDETSEPPHKRQRTSRERQKRQFYVFRFSVPGPCSRSIQVRGDVTWERFFEFCLDSIDFDYDHLYRFDLPDGRSIMRMNLNNTDDEILADQITIAEADLPLGFHGVWEYDFGDSWQFKLYLRNIEEKENEDAELKVIRRTGKPPEQY